MGSGYTGGQYSLWRAGTGIVIAALLLRAAIAGSAGSHWSAIHAAAGLAALLFALGLRDRIAAAAAAIAILATAALIPDATPFLPAGLLLPLVAHLFLPPAPFGSLDARGRLDPGGDWRFPGRVHGVLLGGLGALFAIAGGSVLLGVAGPEARLMLPLAGTSAGIASAAAALAVPLLIAVRRARPLGWIAGLALLAPGLPSAAVLGPLAVWLLLFEPAWIPPARASGPDRVFYDGACGFCQRSIRVLLAEDRGGDAFRLAPRGSAAFAAALPAETRAELPPSIVVIDAEGRVHLRSRATIRLLVRLGGAWRAIGGVLAAVPAPLRDRGYRAIAAVRHRLAPPPERACPLLPPELRARFLPGAEEEVAA